MGKLKGAKIYLAGGMQYEVEAGKSWRIYARHKLHELGIGVIDPLDNPSYNIKESAEQQKYLNDLVEAGKQAEKINDLTTVQDIKRVLAFHMKPIVGLDLRFVDISDALLVYINSAVHTAGTYAEITHALLQRKPVIMFTSTSIFDIPRWWWGHADPNLFFNSLDNIINLLFYD
jgi:nucleoside 2-deoxyribosyltransferase